MKKVLIVEDEKAAMERILSMKIWEGYDFSVCGTASNGKDGFGVYLEENPDIIITDIEMPVMNGLDFIEEVRRRDENIPVIILSCYESFSYAQRAIKLDVQDYLIKDFLDPEVLYATLKSVCRGSVNKTVTEEADLDSPIAISGILYSILEENSTEALYELKKRFEGVSSFSLFLAYRSKNTSGGRSIEELAESIAGGLDFGVETVVSVLDGDTAAVFMETGGRSAASDAAAEIINHVKHADGVSLTIAAGSPFSRIEDIADVYREARNLLEYRIFLGYGRVILPESAESIIWMDPAVTERILSNLKLALMEDDRKEFFRELKSLFSINASGMIQYNYVKYVNMKLAALLINYADEHQLDPSTVFDPDEMLLLETVEEISSWFAEKFSKIFDAKDREQYHGSGNFHVREVVRIIDTEYSGRLSLESLAERSGLHKVYLGRLFKKETGMTCLEYIQQVRVRKAKELLLSSHKTIGQIAAETGFSSYDHLAVVFKKIAGLTPNEFRRKYK